MADRIARRRLGNGDFAAPVYDASGSDDLLSNRNRLFDRQGGGVSHPAPRVMSRRLLRPYAWTGPAGTASTPPNPNVVTPRRSVSREELARLRGEQAAMEGLTRTDKNGRVLTGIDAVEDRNGRFKSGLNAGLMGLTGVGDGAGQRGYGWTQLLSELVRAGGMLLGGMLNKKHDERAKYSRGLEANKSKQGELLKTIEQENKIVKGDMDIEQTGIDSRNKAAAPLLDIGKDMNDLSQVAPVISQILGLPVPARDYRKVEDKERMGVVSSRREGDVEWKPNESTYIDPYEVRRTRTLNGQTYQVPDRAALPAAVGIEQANANRGIAIAKANADAEGDDASAETKYENDVKDFSGKKSAIQGKISAANTTISLAQQDNANLEGQISRLDPKDDKAEIQAIRGQIRQNNEKANAARSNIEALNGELKGLSAPAKPKKKPKIGSTTKINSRRKASYSDSDIQSIIRQ